MFIKLMKSNYLYRKWLILEIGDMDQGPTASNLLYKCHQNVVSYKNVKRRQF